MLINRNQLNNIESSFQIKYHEKLIGDLRGVFSDETRDISDEEMMSIIEQRRLECKSYGIVSERGIFCYLSLNFLCGSDFYEDLSLKDYLKNEKYDSDDAIELLIDEMAEY